MSDVLKYKVGNGLGPVDTQLILSASLKRSPEEWSADVQGVVTPAQALQRVRDILKARDALSFTEDKKLLILTAYELLADLKQQMASRHVDDKLASSLLKTIKTIAEMLDKANLDADKTMMMIRKAHADVMYAAISVAFERTLLELQRRYPEVEAGELSEILQESLPLAATSLEESVVH